MLQTNAKKAEELVSESYRRCFTLAESAGSRWDRDEGWSQSAGLPWQAVSMVMIPFRLGWSSVQKCGSGRGIPEATDCRRSLLSNAASFTVPSEQPTQSSPRPPTSLGAQLRALTQAEAALKLPACRAGRSLKAACLGEIMMLHVYGMPVT